jgi:hypothetical protein
LSGNINSFHQQTVLLRPAVTCGFTVRSADLCLRNFFWELSDEILVWFFAFDSIETPFGSGEHCGSSATYFQPPKFLYYVNLVAVVVRISGTC